MQHDVMAALRSLVLNTTEITDLVGTRVFVNRIPKGVVEGEDTRHPSKMIVLRQAGGASKFDFLPVDNPTIDVLCYGETDKEADIVRREVWSRFVYLKGEIHVGVCLNDAQPISGAISLVDPEIEWPAVAQSWSLFTSAETLAA